MNRAGQNYDVITPTNSIDFLITLPHPKAVNASTMSIDNNNTTNIPPRPCLLSRALHRIRSTPPRIIASPPTRNLYFLLLSLYFILISFFSEPRRAAVALIIRFVPPPNFPLPPKSTTPPSLTQFFDLDWVKHPAARPEILFLRRQKPDNADINENTRDAHVAFPGGRLEEGDEGSLYTGI
jgi:hypothetical protein